MSQNECLVEFLQDLGAISAPLGLRKASNSTEWVWYDGSLAYDESTFICYGHCPWAQGQPNDSPGVGLMTSGVWYSALAGGSFIQENIAIVQLPGMVVECGTSAAYMSADQMTWSDASVRSSSLTDRD